MKTTFSQLPQFGSSSFKQKGLPLAGDSNAPPTSEGFANDSWETILAIIEYGNYKDVYNVGDAKTIELTNIGEITIEIAGFDKDELTDGSGYAAMTFVTKNALTTYEMHGYSDNSISWDNCEMRSWLKSYYLANFPQILRDNIKFVDKTYYSFDGNTTDTSVASDDIWLLSSRETNLFSPSEKESMGCVYDELFPDANSRIKKRTNGVKVNWWTRTRSDSNNYCFYYITKTGTANTAFMTNVNGLYVVFGFCI